MLALALLLASASPALSEIFDLENAAPWLTVGRSRVAFSSGWDAFVVADSSCVRVNSRGVYAKPSHWRPRSLGGTWAARQCAPSAQGGLCDTGVGVAFPASTPAYNASGAWGGLGCSRSDDGRVLDFAHGYDLSACDVLDGGGDVVLCGRALSFARTALPVWSYWLLCLIAVFAVRSLSYLVVNRLGAKVQDAAMRGYSDLATVGACVAALPLVYLPDLDAAFVTDEEALFFDFVLFYCLLYAALFAAHKLQGKSKDPPIYNMIAGTLQAIACRLYLGAETPYNPVIVWAVATRGLGKLRSELWGDWVLGLSALADALLLSLACMVGFSHSRMYLVAIASLSLATSDTLH